MITRTFDYDNLFAGNVQPVVTKEVTIAEGSGELVRGTVLGKNDATGLCTIVNSTKEDGSERPYAILSDDVNATDEDVVSTAYFSGEFNERKLIFGGTDDADTHRRDMREMGLYMNPVVKA